MVQWKAAAMAAMVVWAVGVQAQPVYKWVDANGKTHYGSQPPANKDDLEPMKLQGTNGTTNGSSAGKSAPGKGPTEYNADGTKKIPKEAQEFGEGLKKALTTVDKKEVPMNCAVAVSNIHYQADQMLEVGQKNVRDGYMTQAAFDATAPKIKEAKSKYSVGDCQIATGNKKSFYQCMTSNNNHVMGCDKEFKH